MALSHLALFVWSLLVIVPIIWTFLASFQDQRRDLRRRLVGPAHAGFGAFSRAWSTANIGQDMLTPSSWWRPARS